MYIRNALSKDLIEIVKIYNSTIAEHIATADITEISVESRIGWFEDRDFRYRPIWVIEGKNSTNDDKKIIGWLSFNNFYGRPAYQHTAEISIYVASANRHQGVGSYLLERAIVACPRLQIKILLGFIFAHNKPSLKLFEKYGFIQWGKLPQVAKLAQRNRDLIILGKIL